MARHPYHKPLGRNHGRIRRARGRSVSRCLMRPHTQGSTPPCQPSRAEAPRPKPQDDDHPPRQHPSRASRTRRAELDRVRACRRLIGRQGRVAPLVGHDAARMALCPLSPRHGVLAGYPAPGAAGMDGLAGRGVAALVRRRRRAGTPTPYGGFGPTSRDAQGRLFPMPLTPAHTHTHKGHTEDASLCVPEQHFVGSFTRHFVV